MREQTKEMELELLQYHKSNAALDLMIGELRLKRSGLVSEVDRLGKERDSRSEELGEMQRSIHAVALQVGDAKRLRDATTRLYRTYVHEDRTAGSAAVAAATAETRDAEAVTEEYGRKRSYLERSVESLKEKLRKDEARHRVDQQRLLRESTVLTREINALRRELQQLESDAAAIRTGRALGSDGGAAAGGVFAPKSRRDLRGTGRTIARRGIVSAGLPGDGGELAAGSLADSTAASGVASRAGRRLVSPRSGGGVGGGGGEDSASLSRALLAVHGQLQRLREAVHGDPAMAAALAQIVGPTQADSILRSADDAAFGEALAIARASTAAGPGPGMRGAHSPVKLSDFGGAPSLGGDSSSSSSSSLVDTSAGDSILHLPPLATRPPT